LRLLAIAVLALAGCVTAPASRILSLLPADAILLGEQHDAPDHQRIERATIDALAARGALAAVALEMAEQGHSSAGLPRNASEAQVQAALQWDDKAWPWAAYGPAVMAAVRAGVTVLGANLPRAQMHAAMANPALDVQLPGPALKAQQQAIRLGHCGLLPEGQIGPMTRIQIARDQAMAQTLQAAAVPGKTAVLLSGSGHADRRLGVPRHLPPGFTSKSVLLQVQTAQAATKNVADFDQVWTTPARPIALSIPLSPPDYCAGLRQSGSP